MNREPNNAAPKNRWWTYQRERFPVFGHGPLILAFSSSAIAFSAQLHGDAFFHDGTRWVFPTVVAFATCFIFFLQLRIADEFKDVAEDTEFRPYRPVPRGLVSLRELGWVFAFGALIQFSLALFLEPKLFVLLGVSWLYLTLMSVEFFARDWLKVRPITYLWTHMLIMPLVDFYATSCHWLVGDFEPHPGLKWFIVVSFFNGIVIEVGRKLRRPVDEETGVDTYTRLWGTTRGPLVWLAILATSAFVGTLAAVEIRFAAVFGSIAGVFVAIAALLTIRFVKKPNEISGKQFEHLAGIWTLTLYLGLGLIPYFVNHVGP